MNKLENLIQKKCPNGVEYKKLKDVLQSVKTGLNPRQNFKLNTYDAENYYVTVKEITTGKIIFSDKTDKINDEAVKVIQNRSNLGKGDVLFSGIGTIGKVAVVDIETDNWNCSESVFLLKPNREIITSKFLKYEMESGYVQKIINSTSVGSTLKGVRKETLLNIKIPIPPIEVQDEIVRILDNFTELTAELTAELAARQKQYEYYRNKLLSFDESAESLDTLHTHTHTHGYFYGQEIKWIKLGDIGSVCMCKRIMKNQTKTEGDIPFYKIGTFGKNADAYISKALFKEYKDKYSYPKKGTILLSASGTIGRTVIYNGEPAYFQDSNIVWIDNDEKIILNKYLYYLYKIIDWKVEGGTIKRLYNDNIKNTVIPVPPLDVQEKIVNILDKFDKLTNDISEGLPAEIEARQKQYEYYRNKLLSFNELKIA